MNDKLVTECMHLIKHYSMFYFLGMALHPTSSSIDQFQLAKQNLETFLKNHLKPSPEEDLAVLYETAAAALIKLSKAVAP